MPWAASPASIPHGSPGKGPRVPTARPWTGGTWRRSFPCCKGCPPTSVRPGSSAACAWQVRREVLLETQGTLEGLIIDEPAGTGGFGYDPIFYVPHLGKTVAQLGEDEKNAISHRGNALRKLRPLLDEFLSAQDEQRR